MNNKNILYTGFGILERIKHTVIIPIREVTIEEVLENMAGIDKTYCNTVAEYEEFKQWAIENKFKTPMGDTIDFTWHMYNFDSPIEDLQEQIDNGYDITVMNTSFHLDYYLIKYCPIKFVQDRMREVYRKETIESILNGTSPVDTFNRDSIAGTKVKCCLLYTSPSPRDPKTSRMPSSA